MKFAVALLACLALAVPAASARPAEEFLEPSSPCDGTWAAVYHAEVAGACEHQVLPSRGTGAPAPPAIAASGSAVTRPTASGFDWDSAGIGAAVAIALLSVAAMPMLSRRRVRPAR
jgi:hypothetical protein